MIIVHTNTGDRHQNQSCNFKTSNLKKKKRQLSLFRALPSFAFLARLLFVCTTSCFFLCVFSSLFPFQVQQTPACLTRLFLLRCILRLRRLLEFIYERRSSVCRPPCISDIEIRRNTTAQKMPAHATSRHCAGGYSYSLFVSKPVYGKKLTR